MSPPISFPPKNQKGKRFLSSKDSSTSEQCRKHHAEAPRRGGSMITTRSSHHVFFAPLRELPPSRLMSAECKPLPLLPKGKCRPKPQHQKPQALTTNRHCRFPPKIKKGKRTAEAAEE